MAKAIVLDLIDIGRRFGREPAVDALIGVNLRLGRGEWLAITGPSGAGKSTLLNIIGCLDRPTSGRYLFEDIDAASLTDNQRAGLRSRQIGFVFQSFHLLAHRSVLENVMLAEVYGGRPGEGRRERALAALERVGLSHRVDYLPTKLSGGERQRVAIARALVASPSVLLCDEPTGNLDSKSTADILDLFETLNRQGLTLIVVTHEGDVARRAKRRVQIIDGMLSEVVEENADPEPQEDDDIDEADVQVAWQTLSVDPMPRRRVNRSRLRFPDLLGEVLAGVFARPGRMLLTVLGVVIGLTALVATVGLTRTAGNRIVSAFDELAATEVRVTPKSGPGEPDPKSIPWDAETRLARLNGVIAAGTLSELDVGGTLVRSSPIKDPSGQTAFHLSVQAASPGLFRATRATLVSGRFPDFGHSERADRVAVLGPSAAARLGITDLETLPAIAVGDFLFLVMGVLGEVPREPELLSSVIIPEGTARRDFDLAGPRSVIVETRIGAAALIARQAGLALRPDDRQALRVEFPAEPKRVREAVESNLNTMLLLLGGLTLVVGAIGIGNTTLVSVIERTGEIGLRRAIGATRGHIAAQFFLESTSMGIVGGVLGAGLGVLIVVAVSAYQVWTPVLDPAVPILAPFIGGVIGLISGTYPALRAARMEPVEAFRN